MQENHLVVYISKSLGPRQQALSIYERELLAIVYAVQKWSTYLSQKPFIIRTDQRSIKYILEQKLNTPLQQAWVAKLMGFEFEIHYKERRENKAADALSRIEGAELLPLILNSVSMDLMQQIRDSWITDSQVQKLISELQQNSQSHPHYSWHIDTLRRKGKLVIGNDNAIKQFILQWLHDSATGGHSGRDHTAARVKARFYWKGMTKDVQSYVRECVVCQRSKAELVASPGLLQPLPVSERIWDAISMDFIEGLPKSQGKQVIFVVVDRLSKYAHFMTLSHPYTAVDVAQLFMDSIYKLHGMPSSIVSDRDPIFLSTVWTEFFSMQGVSLHKSTAYHPQTDGQTEIVNKSLETYLRCMCSEKGTDWAQWLPFAEWWYNTNYHSSIHTTPYEVVYGQPPPLHLPYLPGESASLTVDRSLSAREDAIKLLRFHLERAQNRMKQQSDRHRTDRVFTIGSYVFLKLQPYRRYFVRNSAHHKLAPKYYGPYRVLDRIGTTAYQLDLPPAAGIHNVFHVSQLKLCTSPDSAVIQHPPAPLLHTARGEPEAILACKLVKRGHTAATKVLIQWKNQPPEAATWEYYYDLLKEFPHFHS